MPNPYGGNPQGEPYMEQRTSVMAIIALVLGILGCIPGLGLLAIILGIIALVRIGGSNGRLGGRGLAIAGIILGLLLSVVWIGIVSVFNKGSKMLSEMMAGPTTTFFTAAEAGDYAGARKAFTAQAAAQITDDDIKRFVAEYSKDAGKYKQVPMGVLDFFSAYANVGNVMQNYKGNRQNEIPVPVEFSNGWAVVIMHVDKQGAAPAPGGGATFNVENISVLTNGGKEYLLFDPNAPLPAPKAPDTPTLPGTGEKKDTPKPNG
jgi:hypothetical protein